MAEKIVINLHVTPNSKEFKVIGFDSWSNALRLKATAKAEKFKANQEIEEKLSKKLNERVQIIDGLKSRKKKLLIENKTLSEVLECLGVKQ